jgi:hypothetical protein
MNRSNRTLKTKSPTAGEFIASASRVEWKAIQQAEYAKHMETVVVQSKRRVFTLVGFAKQRVVQKHGGDR